jgi:hypothetical protein
MCGACTTAPVSGADVVLRTAYGRGVVAKVASRLDGVVVRAAGTGWTVQRAGRGAVVCTSVAELCTALAPGRSFGTVELLATFLPAGPHRPLETSRGAFPAGAVLPHGAGAPAPADQVVHHVLAAALAADGPGVVTVQDDAGCWLLKVR